MDDEQIRALLEEAIRPRNRAARRRAAQLLNHPRDDEERAIGQRLYELMTAISNCGRSRVLDSGGS